MSACGRVSAVMGLAVVLLAIGGCATHVDSLHDIRTDFFAGNTERAALAIDRELDKGRGDADVLKLERAIVELSTGRPEQAEQTLREVRDSFDYFEQKSLAELALVMTTDDTHSAYAGEDYEKILIRAFLSISNLMSDGGDALAYSLQVNQKQNEIVQAGVPGEEENPKAAYQRVALGPYLFGAIQEETHSNQDDVQRSWAKVVSWRPDFPPGRAGLERARYGRHSERGNGVLYVFTLVGRGPYKEETLEIPSTVALLVADRILSHNGEHTLPPTIAPIKVPKVVVTPNRIQSVAVSVEGREVGQTEVITDIGRMAVQQYEAIYPQVLGRAVARRVVKKGIVYAGKEMLDADNSPWLNLAMDVGGVVWEATEAADTRCWGLLPDSIQVLRIELPAGEHRVGLRSLGRSGGLGLEEIALVSIADGRNTYLLANFPDTYLVGQIVTGQP